MPEIDRMLIERWIDEAMREHEALYHYSSADVRDTRWEAVVAGMRSEHKATTERLEAELASMRGLANARDQLERENKELRAKVSDKPNVAITHIIDEVSALRKNLLDSHRDLSQLFRANTLAHIEQILDALKSIQHDARGKASTLFACKDCGRNIEVVAVRCDRCTTGARLDEHGEALSKASNPVAAITEPPHLMRHLVPCPTCGNALELIKRGGVRMVKCSRCSHEGYADGSKVQIVMTRDGTAIPESTYSASQELHFVPGFEPREPPYRYNFEPREPSYRYNFDAPAGVSPFHQMRTDSIGTCKLCGYRGPGPAHACTYRGKDAATENQVKTDNFMQVMTREEAIKLANECWRARYGESAAPEDQVSEGEDDWLIDAIVKAANMCAPLPIGKVPVDVERLKGIQSKLREMQRDTRALVLLDTAPTPITREEAIAIAQACAQLQPESYYSEPFTPHEWVISAIMSAGTQSAEGERWQELYNRRAAASNEQVKRREEYIKCAENKIAALDGDNALLKETAQFIDQVRFDCESLREAVRDQSTLLASIVWRYLKVDCLGTSDLDPAMRALGCRSGYTTDEDAIRFFVATWPSANPHIAEVQPDKLHVAIDALRIALERATGYRQTIRRLLVEPSLGIALKLAPGQSATIARVVVECAR